VTTYQYDEVRSKACGRCGIERTLNHFRALPSGRGRRKTCNICFALPKKTPEYRRKAALTNRLRRQADPDFVLAGNSESRRRGQTLDGRAKRLFFAARQRASVGNLEFTLTLDLIKGALEAGHCPRTGVAWSYASPVLGRRFNPTAPSVDRKDPVGGYTPDNVRVISCRANKLKNNMTLAEARLLVERWAAR